ncbi:hypothetical protein OG714_16870 [Streptomyces sp. NBC_00989]|nr:hypothetical protein OG714_16870 [Streptomyces sp. NBC_00989]
MEQDDAVTVGPVEYPLGDGQDDLRRIHQTHNPASPAATSRHKEESWRPEQARDTRQLEKGDELC